MQGPFLAAGGFTKDLGDEAIEDKSADLVVYGRWWLCTPDLPERFAEGAPLNHYNRYIPPDTLIPTLGCPVHLAFPPQLGSSDE